MNLVLCYYNRSPTVRQAGLISIIYKFCDFYVWVLRFLCGGAWQNAPSVIACRLNSQVLEGLSEAIRRLLTSPRRLLEGYYEVYQKVTVRYLWGYYGVSGRLLYDLILNNKDLLRIKKVIIYITSQKLFFATYITQYTALHTYYTILSYKINVSGHHLPTHQ